MLIIFALHSRHSKRRFVGRLVFCFAKPVILIFQKKFARKTESILDIIAKKLYYSYIIYARMVELVDTLVSGTRAFTGVQVQVLFRAYNPVIRLDFFMP